MHNNVKNSALTLVPWVVEGTVTRVFEEGRVGIDVGEGEPRSASVALSVGSVALGDRVVVLGNGELDGGGAYVVALLRRADAGAVQTSDGAVARVESASDGRELLRVSSPSGAVIFEYDPATGRSVASAGKGELALRSGSKLVLHGEAGVEISSGRSVRVRAAESVALERPGADGEVGQRVWLDKRGVSVAGKALFALAEKVESRVGEAKLVYQTVTTTAQTARTVIENVDVRVGRLVERARNVLREVEGLHQLRTGRERTVVRETSHTSAGRVVMTAVEDVKLDGQKIRLG